MRDNQRTSGDLTADRRFAYAQGFAEAGDFNAAVDLAHQALEIAPEWAAGWFRLGEYFESAGKSAEAEQAYLKCLNLAPADRLGAALKLSLIAGTQHTAAPLAYAEALFDDYADKFDTALVERLGYCVPGLLKAMLDENLPGVHFDEALDLGCGTGLMGAEVRGRCRHIAGSDLSARMLEKAKAKGLYDRLDKSDLLDAMAGANNVSLIMAADVLMYLPALDSVVAAAAKALAKGGHFLFSVEKYNDANGWSLLPSRRHAHGKDYILHLLAANGFTVVDQREETIRMDAGVPLTGLLWLARLDEERP